MLLVGIAVIDIVDGRFLHFSDIPAAGEVFNRTGQKALLTAQHLARFDAIGRVL